MPALLEIKPQVEKGNWTDFKVFVVEENAGIYADELKKELDNPEKPDLINEIDEDFSLENLEIFKKDKIVFIISSFKENWQENTVREIINKARENKSKILLLTLNNLPLEFENKVYTFKAKDEKQLLTIPKIIIGSVYIHGLVCIDPDDIYKFLLIKDYGKIDCFAFETYPDKLNRFGDFINENVHKNITSTFIQIEISIENQFAVADNTISVIKNIINPQYLLCNVWLNKNFKNKKLKVHLITFN